MVVDANVFKGYFQMEIGKAHCLCGCPRSLMTSASSSNPVFHDDGGKIEHEWRCVVDADWFDAWLSSALHAGVIHYTKALYNPALEKGLQKCGFPRGRDIVYIRVSLAIVKQKSRCDFYTEDLDFYNPKLKGCNSAKRTRILTTSSGPVAKLLARSNINVLCVPSV